MAVKDVQGFKPVPLPRQLLITVGIHGAEGSAPKEVDVANDVGRSETGHLTVADIASFMEFGVPSRGIPQRSFVRAWYDESQDFVRETLQSQMKLVLMGKLTPEKAAARIALAFEGSMKQRVARGIPPPNAPATVEAKGSSKPLINTGQLRNAIRAKAVLE